MEKFIVDRIEEGVVTLENSDLTHFQLKIEDLPLEIHEGSIILFDGSNYTADLCEEEARRKTIFEKQRNIFKNK